MKKLAAVLVTLLALVAVVMTLQNNKAKSEAKAKSVAPRPFAVSVVTAAMADLSDSLTLVGTIAANREVALASETMGRVNAVSGNIGEFRPAGAVLVKVDDELKINAVKIAETTLEKAKRDLERYRQVQTENAIPDVQIDNAKFAVDQAEAQLTMARRQLRDTRITAPFSGVVVTRTVEIGSMVQPGQVVANLVDVSTLKVKLNISEKDLISIRIGNPVLITTDVYPGVSFTGHIANIGAKADEAHTYPVEITVPNRGDHPLRAGMFGRVAFNARSQRKALIVPRATIVGSVKQPQVYVVSNGVVKLRSITVGAESGTDIEVLKGLSQGETVVVNGQNNLRDGMNVEVAK